MIGDDRGQVALEYLLIFAVSLILLIAFTLPLVHVAVEDTLDVSDAVSVKSDLSKIAHAVKEVYGQGQGARQTVTIVSSKDFRVNVAEGYVSSGLSLNDGKIKDEKIYYKSTLKKTGLSLKKGENSIVVEWPKSSENMQIYRN